jgi:MinD-like ATPase involved in chromosome partitioning or flagellar assembly
MSEGAGIKAPKTLADVSHLFFSNAEDGRGQTERARDASGVAEVDGDVEERGRWRPTRIVVVTGGSDAPGKSTVAANLATALTTHGSAALFDADPKLPNARFYLGLPSWHYLSPLAAQGEPAPNTVTDSGLVVADWASADAPVDGLGSGELVYVDVEGIGRTGLDYAVVDVPVSRVGWMAAAASRVDRFVVVARPGLAGFERAFGALAALSRRAGVAGAGLVVNMVPDLGYAPAFHAKLAAAAERLLSMEVRLLGGVVLEPGVGAEQREHGAIVAFRPDAASALLLREIASDVLTDRPGRNPVPAEPGEVARAEVDHESEARAHSAS